MRRNKATNAGSQALPGNPRPRGSASCPAYADWLVDLSDGELPDDLRETVAAHASQCDACRAELARLDQSLAQLKTSLLPVDRSLRLSSAGASPSRRFSPRVAAALGIGLTCLLAVTLVLWHGARTTTTAPQSTPVISQADALRRIALIEEQARLQASLELMPTADWYDEQRAGNQRLLDRLKAAIGTSTEINGETL